MVVYCEYHRRIKMPDGSYVWLHQVARLPEGVTLHDMGVQVTYAPCDFCREVQGGLFSETETESGQAG